MEKKKHRYWSAVLTPEFIKPSGCHMITVSIINMQATVKDSILNTGNYGGNEGNSLTH